MPRIYRNTWRWLVVAVVALLQAVDGKDSRVITHTALLAGMDRFSQPGVASFKELLFDIPRYQLIVGARDYLFRLSLEGLRKLEEAHWPASDPTIVTCRLKGKNHGECRNFIRVLVSHGGKVFACGTNAFAPECTWRDINTLNTVFQRIKGVAICPYSPDYNSTALMTLQGDYYIASALDFSGQDHAIYRIMGKLPFLRTVQYDPKWLSEPKFLSSYEIGNFTYFFFHEAAVEYINCGKIIYSRVARMCKNDQGGQYMLKDNWTTFLKARLNCSIPGNYPFYYNEMQSVHYLEREQMIYATFTTPENSIYGSAICAFNMSAIQQCFTGPFKYQSNPKAAWERHASPSRHFQCETPGNSQHLLDSERYQLMDDAVQPTQLYPLYKMDLERFSHLVVDVVPTKHHDGVHVIFVVTKENVIRKLVVVPDKQETCLIEEIHPFPEGSNQVIKVLKLLRDTSSLYIGLEDAVLRIPVHRCERFKSKSECLNSLDPYCGWNEYQVMCSTAPNRNHLSSFWLQNKTTCPQTNQSVDGGWSAWSSWFECTQTGKDAPGDRCLCQQRHCNNPPPSNGGKTCKGIDFKVTNCTRNGHWTEWSAWSSCSQTCDLAVKTRRRTCGNPSPAYGGRVCIGPERDEIYCTTNPPCPAPTLPPVDGHWSEWSSWDECSAPCNGGVQVRRRRCNNPPPQNNGQECLGCNQDFKFCNTQQCSEVRKSTSWTPWLRVNSTRDGYFEQRFRFSCRANAPDDSMIRGHIKKEERFCLEGNQNCLDAAFVNIDGEWSEWSSWSECSSPCGGGTKYRERACDNPRPAGTGADCPGSARAEVACNTEPCQVIEGWEEWSVWSLCDKNKEQHRRRKCKLPTPAISNCQGHSKEIRMCLPEQLGILTSESQSSPEDGIHAQHVIAACFCGFIVGCLVAAVAVYFYMKRQCSAHHSRLATQLIPVKPNTYVSEAEWKNNFNTGKVSPGKIPLREATIKRNTHFRALIHSDQNF